MRGGKKTSHSGAKHGLGGTSFQRGTQVGRRIMEDSLDQTQPIIELTFYDPQNKTQDSSSLNQPHHGQNLIQQHLQLQQMQNQQYYQQPPQPSKSKSPDTQRIIIGLHQDVQLQVFESPTGSPHRQPRGFQPEAGAPSINIDLAKLTAAAKQPSLRDSGNKLNLQVTELALPLTSAGVGQESLPSQHNFNPHTADASNLLGDSGPKERSQTSLKAVLLQNNSVVTMTAHAAGNWQRTDSAMDSDDGANQLGFQAAVAGEAVRLDPRQIQTGDRETPRQTETGPLTTYASQMYLEKTGPGAHISRTHSKDLLEVTDQASAAKNSKQTGKAKGLQIVGAKVAKMQLFDLGGIAQLNSKTRGARGEQQQTYQQLQSQQLQQHQQMHQLSKYAPGNKQKKEQKKFSQFSPQNMMQQTEPSPHRLHSPSQSSYVPFDGQNAHPQMNDNRFVYSIKPQHLTQSQSNALLKQQNSSGQAINYNINHQSLSQIKRREEQYNYAYAIAQQSQQVSQMSQTFLDQEASAAQNIYGNYNSRQKLGFNASSPKEASTQVENQYRSSNMPQQQQQYILAENLNSNINSPPHQYQIGLHLEEQSAHHVDGGLQQQLQLSQHQVPCPSPDGFVIEAQQVYENQQQNEEFRRGIRDPTNIKEAMAQIQASGQLLQHQIQTTDKNQSSKRLLKEDRLYVSGSSAGTHSADENEDVAENAGPFELRHGQPTSPHLNTPKKSADDDGLSQEGVNYGNVQQDKNSPARELLESQGQLLDEQTTDYQVRVEHIRQLVPGEAQTEGAHFNLGEDGGSFEPSGALQSHSNQGQLRPLNQIEALLQQNNQSRGGQIDQVLMDSVGIFDENLAGGSAGSVNRALNQIENYGQNQLLNESPGKHLDILPPHRHASDLSPFQNPSALENYTESNISPRTKQREVLNMATVNIMSGAVNLEQQIKNNQSSIRRQENYSTFLVDQQQQLSLPQQGNPKTGHPGQPSISQHVDRVKHRDQQQMLKTMLAEANLNHTFMKDNPMFGQRGNNLQQYRDTTVGNFQKVKNYMLRTTLGLRDSASSDTVSTEFNYLQPTVRKLDMNQRASLGMSDKLDRIHVQEHNISPADQSNSRNNSIQIHSGQASPHHMINSVNTNSKDNSSNTNAIRQQFMVNQESQIVFDTPLQQNGMVQPMQQQMQKTLSPRRVFTKKSTKALMHAKVMRSQLSRAKLSPLAVNTDIVRIQGEGNHQITRSVSKLSIDLRSMPKNGHDEEIVSAVIKDKGDKTLRFKDQDELSVTMEKQNFGNTISVSKDPQHLRDTVTDNYNEAYKIMNEQNKIITKSSDIIDLPINNSGRVSEVANSRENSAGKQLKLQKCLNSDHKVTDGDANYDPKNNLMQQKSSKLLIKSTPAQSKTDSVELNGKVSPTKVVVGHLAKFGGQNNAAKARSNIRKAQNEPATFQPTKLRLFEPDLEKPVKQGSVDSQNSGGSPQAHMKRQLSKSSLTKKIKKKQVFANDATSNQSPRQLHQIHQQLSKTTMKQVGTQVDSMASHEMIKTIDVKDKRLMQPSMLTSSSHNSQSQEKRSFSYRKKRNQSFTTILPSNDSPTNENFGGSKLSQFMPAVFSTNFSQTYVDLLKNMRPYDVKSNVTSSEENSPKAAFRSQMHAMQKSEINEVNQIETQTEDDQEQTFAEQEQKLRLSQNPEIQFYLSVLERIRKTHKDVISTDAVKKIQQNYKKYIASGSANGKGLFGDIESQKMVKPLITLSNDDVHDPMMLQLRNERSLQKQYNIAAITNQGVDDLPRRWKKLSPINRLKTKLKLDATNKRYENDEKEGKETKKHSRNHGGGQVSQSVNVSRIQDIGTASFEQDISFQMQPQQTKNLFKSLISSQEFDVELGKKIKEKDLPTIYASQTLYDDMKNNKRQLISLSKVESPKATSKLLLEASQVSSQVDLMNNNHLKGGIAALEDGQNLQHDRKANRKNSPQKNKNHNTTLSVQVSNVQMPLTSARQQINENSTKRMLDVTFMTQLQSNLSRIEPVSTTNTQGAMSPLIHRSFDNREKNAAILSLNDSIQSKDPAAYPTNPHALLAQQKSQFADLLSFGKGKVVDLKNRVGQQGQNPFLNEIEERLRNPNGRAVLLEKSLVARNDYKDQMKKIKPKVQADKTIKIATKDIYDSVRVHRSIPPVALHRMDKISRNLTESLIAENAQQRIPMRDWQKQEVMLPILNTAKRNITLHTSVDLSIGDIQRQKKIMVNDQKRSRQRKHMFRSLEPQLAEMESNRAGTQLSKHSIETSMQDQATLMGLSPKPTNMMMGSFNNQMLRQATDMSLREENQMKVFVSARRKYEQKRQHHPQQVHKV